MLHTYGSSGRCALFLLQAAVNTLVDLREKIEPDLVVKILEAEKTERQQHHLHCVSWMCTWMEIPSLNTLFLVHRLTPHSLPWFFLFVYANLIPGHPTILSCFFLPSFHPFPLSPLSIHSYTTPLPPSHHPLTD